MVLVNAYVLLTSHFNENITYVELGYKTRRFLWLKNHIEMQNVFILFLFFIKY